MSEKKSADIDEKEAVAAGNVNFMERELRKFGLMRKFYLESHKRGIYAGLLLLGGLKKHLLIIQNQAEERFDLLMEQMVKWEKVTEQLKAQFQMLWL